MILSIGGIPLIYLGDEVGMLNDYGYRNDPTKAGDSRWVHRPYADWAQIAQRTEPDALQARVYGGLRHLIGVRKGTQAFAGDDMSVVDAGNPHIFAYLRQNTGARILILANLSEHKEQVAANTIRNHGLSYRFQDLVRGETIELGADLLLEPYQFVWLAAT